MFVHQLADAARYERRYQGCQEDDQPRPRPAHGKTHFDGINTQVGHVSAREEQRRRMSAAGTSVYPLNRIQPSVAPRHTSTQSRCSRCALPPKQNVHSPVKLINSSALVPTPHVVVRQQDLLLPVDDALALIDAAEGAVVAVHLCHVRPVLALTVAGCTFGDRFLRNTPGRAG
eukprot:COSAG03_NODE_3534_length_1962_cov_3.972088_1_plen_173_part_00